MSGEIFPPALRARLHQAPPRPVPHPGALLVSLPIATTLAAGDAPVHVDVAAFAVACEAVGGRVSRATSADEVAEVVCAYLEDPRTVTAWPGETLPLPGVHEALRARGVTLLDPYVTADVSARRADLDRLAGAPVGLTGPHAALIDTGSVVLSHRNGRGRLQSLLPPVHVALVPVASLHVNFTALLAAEPGVIAQTANLVLVTGPSRTADIEMTLTRGVHGPRIIHVVFIG
ncbi:MAG: LutC/YkgG family protein [Luteitalea sp.]